MNPKVDQSDIPASPGCDGEEQSEDPLPGTRLFEFKTGTDPPTVKYLWPFATGPPLTITSGGRHA